MLKAKQIIVPCVALLGAITASAHAAGPRPIFQAPFACGQAWDASTYGSHWPDPDTVDLVQRGPSMQNYTEGEAVLAAAAGTVARSFIDGGGGYRIYLDHGDGWVTHYLHLEVDEYGLIAEGRQVAAGEQIARASNSGTQAMHLHHTQLRDGGAVRIHLDDEPIQTSQADESTWGHWGSEDAETLRSYNCRDGSYMHWTTGGNNFFLRYRPSTGESTILTATSSGALSGVSSENIGQRWSHFAPFYIDAGGQPHAIYYSHSLGTAQFRRFNLDGSGSIVLSTVNWWGGWTHLVPVRLDGDAHVLAYSSLHGFANVDDLRSDGSGSTRIYATTWARGATNVVPFEYGANQYVLMYYGGTGNVEIWRLSKSNDQVSRQLMWQSNWADSWSHLKITRHENAVYLLSYDEQDGDVSLRRLASPQQGFQTTANIQWQYPWTSITPFLDDGSGHFILYNARDGLIRNYRLNAGGTGIQRQWAADWLANFR